jgi:arylsulfatase A-like enzyme
MGEHGHFQKMTLFENAAHVPLIISVPGMRNPGTHSKSIVEMVDYFPTLSELCGLTPPVAKSGISQAALFDDPSKSPRTAALTQHRDGYSLRTDRYRYTEWGSDGRNGAELYDHLSDPMEMANLASKPELADTISELKKQLHDRIAAARAVPVGLKQVVVEEPRRGQRQGKGG